MQFKTKILTILILLTFNPSQVFAQTAASQASVSGDYNTGNVRGVVVARDNAVIGSSMSGRMIKEIPHSDGEAFEDGAVLVRFDCTRSQAEARAAWAAANALETTLNSNRELDQYGAIGKNDVLISASHLARAQAQAAALDAAIRDCVIYAPYPGRVVERFANIAETPNIGAPLIKIQREGNLELTLIVPSHWLIWLTPETPFEFRVDETGKTFDAKVIRLGAAVDPVSKTIRVVGTFTPPAKKVLPGMSGEARFRIPTQK